jgi:hypothetical protein
MAARKYQMPANIAGHFGEAAGVEPTSVLEALNLLIPAFRGNAVSIPVSPSLMDATSKHVCPGGQRFSL